MVVHHLAVDGVSWRILLEDLEMAYQQLSRGDLVQLPGKTTAFTHWAQRLIDHVQSGAHEDELDYWLAVFRTKVSPLPVDYEGAANTVASGKTVSVSLTVEDTQALLYEVPNAYHTQINDALLTALAQAFAGWTGRDSVLIDLEGHGREEIVEGADLSRTVGWFTTIFPVLLSLEGAPRPGDAMKSIKEQLRRVPAAGIGYGLLRYLSGKAGISEPLASCHRPEVSFNYLGQFDQLQTASSLFGLIQNSSGPPCSLRGTRSHHLEINALVIDGRLRMNWTYSEDRYESATVEALAQGFLDALRVLIAHCQSPEAGGHTPSDFPLIDLSQKELEEFLERIT